MITKFFNLLEVKRYSKITQKTYIKAISQFLEYFSKIDPSKINNEDMFIYIEHKTKKPLR
jgi:hypothetical protein